MGVDVSGLRSTELGMADTTCVVMDETNGGSVGARRDGLVDYPLGRDRAAALTCICGNGIRAMDVNEGGGTS